MQPLKQNQKLALVILALLAVLVVLAAALVLSRESRMVERQAQTAGSGDRVYHWKLVTTWPKNLPGLGTAPVRLAEAVAAASNGRLQIEVYADGEIVPAMQVFDAVSRGTAEMGHGAAYYWKGKLAAAPFFSTIPFGLTAQEMNGWLHYGGGMELWREAYAPFNLYPLAGGNTGVQMGGWFNREINSMEDIKGLKMRIPGLAGEVFTRAGGTAVSMPGGELFTSLQTGVIDALEWVAPYNDRALGFYKVAKYYYYPGWHEPGPALEIIINQQAWNSLPADLQAILTMAARSANQDMLDEYTAQNNSALRDLVDRNGVQLRKFPDDVLRSFREISETVLQEEAAKDPQFNKIYQSFRSYREGVQAYHQISEQAFLEARSAP